MLGERVEGEAEQRAIAVADPEGGELQPACGELFGNAEGLEHVEGVRVDHGGARRVLAFGQLVDQHVPDAGLLQGDGQRQAGRAGADDQNVRFLRKHGVFSICQHVLTLRMALDFVNRC